MNFSITSGYNLDLILENPLIYKITFLYYEKNNNLDPYSINVVFYYLYFVKIFSAKCDN